jgi:tetratricopeptide (TPR) repeat protein
MATKKQANDIDAFISEAVRRVSRGDEANVFLQWWLSCADKITKAMPFPPPLDRDEKHRIFLNLGRKFWSSVPLPTRGWRTHPKLEAQRNDPCYCGSGKKYKHCCQSYEALPSLIPPDAALAIVVDSMGADAQSRILSGEIPPHAMAHLAELWNERGDRERTVDTFAPYFASDPDIDERIEQLFDCLMDAMLELGMSAERETLLKKMSTHRNKSLACAALARLIAIYTDLGNFEDAWQAFRDAQRRSPDDPQLAHLEILLLNSEGREDEARVRAPMIAARLRKLSPEYADLADVVEQLAQGGIANVRGEYESDYAPEEIGAWVALGGVARGHKIDAASCQKLYKLSVEFDESIAKDVRIVESSATLRKIDTKWDRQFPVESPFGTQSVGDVDAVLDELPDVAYFMHANPQAWSSVHVLDVLLQSGIALYDDTHSFNVLEAANEIAAHAVKLIRALFERNLDQPTPWLSMQNRPLLRLVANAAILADKKGDKKTFVELVEWVLKLNPNDNHGWRAAIVAHRLTDDDATGALEILDRYLHDFPPSAFQRTLALFMLDRRDQAAKQWVLAARGSAHIVEALLSERVSQPREDASHGIAVGGKWEAHHYRQEMRNVWKRTGALAWATQLPQVKAKPAARDTSGAKKSGANKRAEAAPRVGAADVDTELFALSPRPLADTLEDAYKHLPNAARIVGMLTGTVWSPSRNPPVQWMGVAIQWAAAGDAPGDMQATLTRLTTLYNALNAEVLNGFGEAALPRSVLRLLDAEDEATLTEWAAGFVVGCEASAYGWRAASISVSAKKAPFAALYSLAARAPLAQSETPFAPNGATSIRDDTGQPLLVGLDAGSPSTVDMMKIALMPLWEIARRRAAA